VRQEESGGTTTIYVDREYDGFGRVKTVSNPYETGSSGTTATAYDGLDRAVKVTHADGSVERTCYAGRETVVRDAAGKWKKLVQDGLGRLVQVVEDATGSCDGLNYSGTNISTQYAYDALDRLKVVCQGGTIDASGNCTGTGALGRRFDYDSLGRLTQAQNPEMSAVSYSYDTASNLLTKAYGEASGDGLRYVGADGLGSTRVVLDGAGLVAERYDYYPFGDMIGAGVNGRTVGMGYEEGEVGVGVRVRFTGKERDAETGLDYFGARSFSGAMGRFTSPDVPLLDQYPEDPQSWNLYAYGRNNPLRFTDPTGNYVFDSSASEDEKKRFREQQAAAQAAANALRDKYGEKSKQYTNAARALAGYGAEGVANGVTVAFGAPQTAGAGAEVTLGLSTRKTADNPTGQNIRATFNASAVSAGLIGHEGQHVADASAWIAGGYASALNPTAYQGEFDATRVQLSIMEGQGNIGAFLGSGSTRRLMWFQGWPESNVTNTINSFLAIPRSGGGLYGLTPTNPRRLFTRPRR
jgi:RHS repeat-associated protein